MKFKRTILDLGDLMIIFWWALVKTLLRLFKT